MFNLLTNDLGGWLESAASVNAATLHMASTSCGIYPLVTTSGPGLGLGLLAVVVAMALLGVATGVACLVVMVVVAG